MKNKRIACICNANNFFLPLVKYLRDNGVDADLLVLQNDMLNTGNPEWDSFDDSYKNYTKFVNWGFYPQGFFSINKDILKDDLNKYDILIGQGHAPAFANRIGRTLDIFMPNGGDIITVPFIPKEKMSLNRRIKYFNFIYHQRKGIKRSKKIFLDQMVDDFEKLFLTFNTTGQRVHTTCPFLYLKDYSEENILKNCGSIFFYNYISQLKLEGNMILLNHSRQVWTDYHDLFSVKGNDKVIYGFKMFLDKHPNFKIKLVMIEHGVDVVRSKELLIELGIQDNVIWLPRLKRKELMLLICLSDLTTGQFGYGYLTSGAIFEALAMAKPIIHNRDDEKYSNYEELYPILYANTAVQIYEAISAYVERPEFYKLLGLEGQKWFIKYGIQKSLNYYLEAIKEFSAN